jgi:small subunit ribosomal protein S16
MATKIRLRRMGSRNKPFYRLVAADSRFATTGRFLETLGWYDPKKKADNFSISIERVDYWIDNGAQLSATAKSLVKKAKAGQGVPYGSAPEKSAPSVSVETAVSSDESEIPVSTIEEEPVAEASPVEAEEVKMEEAAPVEEPVEAKEEDASDNKEA